MTRHLALDLGAESGRAIVGSLDDGSLTLIVQAVAQGEVASLTEERAIIRKSFAVETFEPKDRPIWQDAYGRYIDL